jgi:hypothetical protein
VKMKGDERVAEAELSDVLTLMRISCFDSLTPLVVLLSVPSV